MSHQKVFTTDQITKLMLFVQLNYEQSYGKLRSLPDMFVKERGCFGKKDEFLNAKCG